MIRFGGCLLVGLLAVVGGPWRTHAEEESEPPLPRWSPQELDAMRANPNRPLGLGDLLGEPGDLDEMPANRPPLLGEGEEILGDSPERIQPSADLSRFLPLSLLEAHRSHPAPQTSPSPLASLVEAPPEFLRECEAQASGTHLIDPNHELSETVVEDFDRFLTFHASDSGIPLTLVVLGRNQKLPEGVNLASFAGGSVATGSSAVVVCPYGEPWRVRFFVSQTIRDAAPASYLNSLLDNCVRDALRATDPDEQLHRLLVQFSVRLFWVKHMLAPGPGAGAHLETPAAKAPPASSSLEEVVIAAPAASVQRPWFNPLAFGIVLLLCLVIYIGMRWHRFKLRHFEWLLPAPATPVPPRFGGTVCGGSVSIRYR